MITWVVGSGGLLGSALVRQLGSNFAAHPVPWSEPLRAAECLESEVARFASEIADRRWSIIWAAGAATTSSSASAAESELEPLRGLLTGIRTHLADADGQFFLTSSAGGVYAGSAHPPFSSATPVHPLSPYGELKLAQESLAGEMLAGITPVTVGRVSNLYGPGQDLSKLQGLISRLALASITRQPIDIFVPLDTIRDYIYVDDAARTIIQVLHGHASSDPLRTELVASGSPVTVGQLIQTMNLLAKKRVPVALGSHPSARSQALDLRLLPSIPVIAATPLPAGMKAVHLDLITRMQQQHVDLRISSD